MSPLRSSNKKSYETSPSRDYPRHPFVAIVFAACVMRVKWLLEKAHCSVPYPHVYTPAACMIVTIFKYWRYFASLRRMTLNASTVQNIGLYSIILLNQSIIAKGNSYFLYLTHFLLLSTLRRRSQSTRLFFGTVLLPAMPSLSQLCSNRRDFNLTRQTYMLEFE